MWHGARRCWHSGCHPKSRVSNLRRRDVCWHHSSTSGHRCDRSSRELDVTDGWLALFTCITYAYGWMIGALHLYYLYLRLDVWRSSPVKATPWFLSTAPTVLWTTMKSLRQASQSQTKGTNLGPPTTVHISCSELCVLSHLAQVGGSSEFGDGTKYSQQDCLTLSLHISLQPFRYSCCIKSQFPTTFGCEIQTDCKK